MDKYEFRRQRLAELKDAKCGGNAAELARTIGREPSYVSRMLYKEGKPGKKRIAEDMVGVIEAAFSVPGWFTPEDEKVSSGLTLAAFGNDKLLMQLIDLYGEMKNDDDRHSLVSYANFLLAQRGVIPTTSNPFPNAALPAPQHRTEAKMKGKS